MKKKILYLGIILIISVVAITLVGCGSDDEESEENSSSSNASSNVEDALNKAIEDEVSTWEENQTGRTFTVYFIQSAIDNNGDDYVIVASGDTAFTIAPEITEYTETNIDGYLGLNYSNLRMLEEDLDVNYLLVYDASNEKYYNVDISYDKSYTFKSGAEIVYPTFSNAVALN